MLYRNRYTVFICLASVLCMSCVNTKKAAYFPDLQNDTIKLSNYAPDAFIKGNDLLSIVVSSPSPDPAATSIFNVSNPAPTAAAGYGYQQASYLVDSKGYIQFPILGNIHAEGLTKEQLSEVLVNELSARKFLSRPIVTIRHLNYTVTVLGEVGKPSVINAPSERISLLEALGLAGDITVYGKKDNVLVIREENNKKIAHRLNLNSTDLFYSDFYYLKPNDIVYVETKKAKVSESGRGNQLIPIITAVITVGIIAIDRLVK